MSFIAPSLPQGAKPFSPAQRAWLDGFIAGLVGEGGNQLPGLHPAFAARRTRRISRGTTPACRSMSVSRLPPGGVPEHLLMAAMAQTGLRPMRLYLPGLCRGDRQRHRRQHPRPRCAPGGKATSRKLRVLLGDIAVPAAATFAAAPTIADATPPVGASRACPTSRFRPRCARGNARLNGDRSEKDTLAGGTVEDRRKGSRSGTSSRRQQRSVSSRATARNSGVGAIVAQPRGEAEDTPVLSPDGIERSLLDGSCRKPARSAGRPTRRGSKCWPRAPTIIDESRILQAMAEGISRSGAGGCRSAGSARRRSVGAAAAGGADLRARPVAAAALLFDRLLTQGIRGGRNPS